MGKRIFLMLLAQAISITAYAADWPAKPITMVVTLSAGAGGDLTARLFTKALEAQIGQKVVVENMPGASNMLGLNNVAQARADGYRLLFVTTGIAALPAVVKSFSLDFAKDVTPISEIVSSPMLIMVHPTAPFAGIDEMVHYMRQNPGKLNYAGASSTGAMAFELFRVVTGTKFETINYAGPAQSATATMRGDAHFMLTTPGQAKIWVDSGQLRALAVTGARPSRLLPKVPTFGMSTLAEVREVAKFSGLAGTAYMVIAPPRMPPDTLKAISSAVMAVTRNKDFVVLMRDTQDMLTIGNSPAEAAANLISATAAWTKIARDAGIKPK